MRWLTGTSVVCLSVSWGPRAALADTASCVELHASGQREAKAGHLRRASELFASCGSGDQCPQAVRTECIDLYGMVQKTIPTVVFSVSDEQGKDITNVQVYSGDQPLVQSLDGRPVALDPGKHRFRFVLPWGEVLSSDVLVREGEKNRLIAVQVHNSVSEKPKSSSGPGSTVSASLPPSSPEATAKRSLPAGFWVASGVGVAALGSWGFFALLGRGKQNQLESCAPNCDFSQRGAYDAMRRDYLIADISLGVAAVSVGVAAWLFLAPRRPATAGVQGAKAMPPRVAVVPWVTTCGAALGLAATGF